MLEIAVICAFALLLIAAFMFVRSFVLRTDPVAVRLAAEQDFNDEPPLGDLTKAFAAQIKQSSKEMSQVERDLRRAGRYTRTAYADFQGGRVFVALMLLLATGAAVLSIGVDKTPLVYWITGSGALLAALAYAVPRFTLASEGNRRVMRLENGLPDGLDMMTMSIAGGLTLRQSLDHVAREIRPAHPELALELAIVNEQSRLGTIQQAFRNFGDRTDSAEIRSLSALVSDSEKLGTNVETTIREHADSMRRSVRQRADERASKTNVKLIMPFALLLVPAMLLMLWAPPLMTLSAALERELQPGGALSVETLNQSIDNANLDLTEAMARAGQTPPDTRGFNGRSVNRRGFSSGNRAPSRLDRVFGPSDQQGLGTSRGARVIR
ncbi:MAG: type II secretion system F family protein [Pirellulales bacterium]|nr:type II secretion system F family protein [Pirellulales bacterium]